ncbi:MAG: ABC transporter substrate-binding protein [Alphaproteobacteria bacterium]|nr:ABC transporter substrate-binding protein [Alphaproteobacteria bacterium]
MIARRALGLAAASSPLASSLRAADPARIAVVLSGTPQTHTVFLAAFRRGLTRHGLVEGREVVLADHYLEGDFSRLPELALAIMRSQPRIIVAAPGRIVAGLRHETTTIPIVMATGADPVGVGLAASLARPGGNVTGLSNQGADVVEKQFGFLPELLPGLRRVLGLRGATALASGTIEAEFLRLSERLGIAARSFIMDDRPDFDRLRATIAEHRPDALFVFNDPVPFAHRRAIVAIADSMRLPTVAPFRDFAEVGALASYGANLVDAWERAAWFVDRILKGANPAEMPIEQPTRFELVINMKTARALGLTIPASILAGADEVIE